MAEKKAAEQAMVVEILHAPPPPTLGRAAESTNPLVHQLLAAREIHDRNGDTDAVAAVDTRLAELGVR